MNKPLIIITGASSGIGAATAKLFSEEGYATALLARNKNTMDSLQLKNSISIECDVTDIDFVKNAINLAQEKFGAVDCLINNAGFAKNGEFTEVSHDDNQKMIDGVAMRSATKLPKMILSFSFPFYTA
jgi:NADP-dependent 3-hydroxy acid dehydrogenase YdfG